MVDDGSPHPFPLTPAPLPGGEGRFVRLRRSIGWREPTTRLRRDNRIERPRSALPSAAHRRRAAVDVQRQRARRERRAARHADRRRASADALRRQARDPDADDAGRRARGAGDRLPAQPASAGLASRTSSRCRSTGTSNAVVVTTRHGLARISTRSSASAPTTSGCGQGTVFGDLMDEIDSVRLPADATLTRGTLLRAARPRAPARDDLQAGGRRARLRARNQRRRRRARSSTSSRTSAATTRSTPSPA